MNILFVHQNFPGQFKSIAPALASDSANEVVAMSMGDLPALSKIHHVKYNAQRGSSIKIHPWVTDIETKVIRGEAAYNAAKKIKERGFSHDAIIAHPGWGESLFLKDVWPKAKLGIYCEFFYKSQGGDTGFDGEFPQIENGFECKLRLRNLNNMLHFDIADAAVSPTVWQASTFPNFFQKKISVIHDGIDTLRICPNSNITLKLSSGQTFGKGDEIITFVNRNLEPYRGYHIFMRALPKILKDRPKAHVLIVGGDSVSYGAAAPNGGKWKDIFLNEVKKDLDMSRIHFLGSLPYAQYLAVMQLSSVHVYLTYPFVLSWSLLEAMSVGCAVVASNTSPLVEVINHEENGLLVDFFDVNGFSEAVIDLLANPVKREFLSKNARQTIIDRYDLAKICLPKQLNWVKNLYEGSSGV